MKFSNYIAYLFYTVLTFSNCVQEFDPPSRGYENLLVVEAFLSNKDEPFTVNLSRSIPIDTTGYLPESGASIMLSDDKGAEYFLEETKEAGVYRSATSIGAQTGNAYQLHIKTSNGNEYESASVPMRYTPNIDSVFFRYEERPASGKKGIQIYIDSHDPENNTGYYRWEWEETWMFFSKYYSYLEWDNGQIKMRDEQINKCWDDGRSTSIELSSSKNLTVDRISFYPLLYISDETERLKYKYTINVKQYGLSEEAYTYWQELQKATESLGTLFDPQPSIVSGNIYNIYDENEVVLGYFDASEVVEKRIFINRSDLPTMGYPDYYAECFEWIGEIDSVEIMINRGYGLMTDDIDPYSGDTLYHMSYERCYDCRIRGTNKKPDFWE